MILRVLIVDDEPPARSKVKRFLESHSDIAILGEAQNGLEALTLIEEHTPDLVFLDVQMPQMTGIEMLEHLPQVGMPCIVFTTAYDQYTLKAFDFHAVDYLLKPFDRQRFETALERAKERQAARQMNQDQIVSLLQSLQSTTDYLKRFLIKGNERMYFIDVQEVEWLEATNKYITLHKGKEEHLLRNTLNYLEEKLDPELFIRIHRSYMVRHDFIKEIQSLGMGEYVVVLKNEIKLNLGKKYKNHLFE